MSRLINADDIVYESIDGSDTCRHERYYGTGIVAVRKEDIDAMPTIEPEQRWIPCSERLPEVDKCVLVTTEWNDISIAWRIGIEKWFIHEGNTNATTDDLIAWMPLPEPYERQENHGDNNRRA